MNSKYIPLIIGPTLETERLILRPPLPEDFPGFVALMSDERSARYIGGVQEAPMAWRGFACIAGSWVLKGFGMFSVIEKSSKRWIGRIGPWQPEGWPGTEVGWGLIVDAWGKGYASEAAIASIDWAFENLGWTEVIHTIDLENEPSKKLARRLGSECLGPTKLPKPFEHSIVECFGQTKEQWKNR